MHKSIIRSYNIPKTPVITKSIFFAGADIPFTDKAVFARPAIASSSPTRRYPVIPDISATGVACTDVAEPGL